MLPQFDRRRLKIKPLAERIHDLAHTSLLYLEELPPSLPAKGMADLAELGKRLVQAREKKASVLMMMGAHVLRAGVQRPLIDMMERGLITHIGMNGAGPIHDYELARIGATCESVARYIRSGEFGLWRETGEINDIVRRGALSGLGLGESIGKAIQESDFPHKDISVLAAGFRLGIPVTVHIGIGYDIIHEHPNFDPASFGTASYRDFLAVCHTVSKLEGGVFLCFGSAVMGPEVYLKALSMARNVAHQEGRKIANFTTAAFDLIPIEGDLHSEASKTDPQYYYRPWKTILVRTVADGGESFYVCGDHRQTVPHLRESALSATRGAKKNEPAPLPAKKSEAATPPKSDTPAARKAESSSPPKSDASSARKAEAPSPPKSNATAARKADPPPTRKASPPPSMTEVIPRRKADPEPSRKAEPATLRKPEAPPARKSDPASVRSAEPVTARKPEAIAARKAETELVRKAEPVPARNVELAAARKVEPPPRSKDGPAAARKSDPPSPTKGETGSARKVEAIPERKPEPRLARRIDDTPVKKPEASVVRSAGTGKDSENPDGAVAHYQQLKEWVRANDADDLEWYESSQKEGWHYSTITKEDYLRLYYRMVWTSGMKSRVVVAKEQEYFRVVNEVLYPKKTFNAQRQGEFLMKAGSVLGGSGDNSKNKAVFQVISQIESLGWEEFQRQYVKPSSSLATRLKQLPMLSPKTIDLLLQRLGINDSSRDDLSLFEFADQYGYDDWDKCVREIEVRTGDDRSTIQFIVWDAAQKDAVLVKS